MEYGIWGHSIALECTDLKKHGNSFLNLLDANSKKHIRAVKNLGKVHISSERITYEIIQQHQKGKINCAVVFWALPYFYWYPGMPIRDFEIKSKNIRKKQLSHEIGTSGSIPGTHLLKEEVINNNLGFQNMYTKEHCKFRHDNAILRLETYAKYFNLPIIHYPVDSNHIPKWLTIQSGPVVENIGNAQNNRLLGLVDSNTKRNRLTEIGDTLLYKQILLDLNIAEKWHSLSIDDKKKHYERSSRIFQRLKKHAFKLARNDKTIK